MIGKLRHIVGSLLRFLRRNLLRDPFYIDLKRWQEDRGDDTLRLDYPLNGDSVVLDLGGFRGDFAAAMHARYGCSVLVFEPMPSFFEACSARFAGVEGIRCYNYGLSSGDDILPISDSGDASSFVRGGDNTGIQARLRSVVDVWKELGLTRVDLLKINIEGGEFDVLPALIESGLIRQVRYLQVQFHTFVDDAKPRRQQIREQLSATHEEMWNYEFVWESWRLK